MLPIDVAAVLLLLFSSWWTLVVVSWVAWERRFESPSRRDARLAERVTKKRRWSTLLDVLEFGLPFVIPLGLGLDGLLLGGRVLSSQSWSFLLPFADVFQILGAVLLSLGLPLFTTGAYLTGKYVFSKQPEERPLLDRGPYRYVRHPIYLSFLLIGSGFILLALNYVALPLALFLTAFTYPGPEEEELVKLYGDAYREYQRRTGKFLPKLRRNL